MSIIQFKEHMLTTHTEQEFINSTTFEDKRYVGFKSTDNQIISVIIIDENYALKNNINYLEIHKNLNEFNFYIQKCKEDSFISIEDNLELIQKHFEQLKIKNSISKADTDKAKKSYKHL